MFPSKGAIALKKFFKLNRLIELTIITGIPILIAADFHQFLIDPKFLENLRVIFLITEIFPKSEADTLANLIIMLAVEVMFILNGAAEGMFHRITIRQVEHMMH